MPYSCRPKAAFKFPVFEFSADGKEILWENIRISWNERQGHHLQFKNLPCGTLIPYGGKTISRTTGNSMLKNPNRHSTEYLLFQDEDHYLDGNPKFEKFRYCWSGAYVNELDKDSREKGDLFNCQFIYLRTEIYRADMPDYPGIDLTQEYLPFVEIMSNVSQTRANRDKWITAFLCYDPDYRRSRAELKRRGYMPCPFTLNNIAPGWKEHWLVVSHGAEEQVLRERRDMLETESQLDKQEQDRCRSLKNSKKRPSSTPFTDNTGKKYNMKQKKRRILRSKTHPESL